MWKTRPQRRGAATTGSSLFSFKSGGPIRAEPQSGFCCCPQPGKPHIVSSKAGHLGECKRPRVTPWESKAKPGCRPSLPAADVPAAGPGGLPVSSESGSAGSDDGEALLSIRATAGLSFDQDPPPGSLPDRQPPRCEPQPGFSVSVLLPRASDPGNLPPLGTSTSALDIWADPGIWGNLTLRTE